MLKAKPVLYVRHYYIVLRNNWNMDKYSLAIRAPIESPWVHQLTKVGIMDDFYIHVKKFGMLSSP